MKIYTFLRTGWLMLAGLVLVVVIGGYDGTPNSDVELFLIGSMMVLSFPSAWLVGAVFSLTYMLLGSCCDIVIKTSYLVLILEWLALFAVGYWQWFVLIPWAVRKWRARRIAPISSVHS
jgi:hypothetical protein